MTWWQCINTISDHLQQVDFAPPVGYQEPQVYKPKEQEEDKMEVLQLCNIFVYSIILLHWICKDFDMFPCEQNTNFIPNTNESDF